MLTERRQQQVIADLVHGLTPTINPENLQDPYDYLWEIVINRPPHEAYQELLRTKLSEADLTGVIDDILTLEPGYQPKHQSLAEIGPSLPQTTWFWPNWIPRGVLTLLAAWPGVGKTYLALDLAQRVIADRLAPDESPFQLRTGNVIYVDAEDFLSDIYERATVWGMDLNKFFPIQRPPRDLIDMSRAEYQDQLIEMCYDLRPDLVIVDSLSSVNSKGGKQYRGSTGCAGLLRRDQWRFRFDPYLDPPSAQTQQRCHSGCHDARPARLWTPGGYGPQHSQP